MHVQIFLSGCKNCHHVFSMPLTPVFPSVLLAVVLISLMLLYKVSLCLLATTLFDVFLAKNNYQMIIPASIDHLASIQLLSINWSPAASELQTIDNVFCPAVPCFCSPCSLQIDIALSPRFLYWLSSKPGNPATCLTQLSFLLWLAVISKYPTEWKRKLSSES